jgi:hypothetical protein
MCDEIGRAYACLVARSLLTRECEICLRSLVKRIDQGPGSALGDGSEVGELPTVLIQFHRSQRRARARGFDSSFGLRRPEYRPSPS